MHRTSPIVRVLLVALLGCAACGGDDDGTGANSTTTGGGGGGGGGGSAPCQAQATSSLPGVSIEFTTSDCNYTLAEAAAGIAIEYEVLVEADLPNVFPQPQDGCSEPGPSGLIPFEDLAGGGQHYCRCDVGNCPGPSGDPVTVVQGSHPATFAWDGRNWNGPSDFGAPKGDPFPAGDYTLTVSAVGAFNNAGAQMPFQVEGTFLLHLLP